MSRTARVVAGLALVLVGLGAGSTVAAAAETVTVDRTTVYLEPDFQSEVLGSMTGRVSVECSATADAGFNAGGVVLYRVFSGLAGGTGYIEAPPGRPVDVPAC